MAGYGESTTVLSAGDISDDLTTLEFRGLGADSSREFHLSWTGNDTPAGTWKFQSSPDGSSWRDETIPSSSAHEVSNCSLSGGGIVVTDGVGYAVVRMAHMPRRWRWEWTHGSGATADTATIVAL